MENITVDTIIDFLRDKVEKKQAEYDPKVWIEAGLKLNLLLGAEQDKLADMYQEVAKLKLMWLEGQDKRNVSEAKVMVEASPEYTAWKKQDMKCRRVEEFVRLTKKVSDRVSGY